MAEQRKQNNKDKRSAEKDTSKTEGEQRRQKDKIKARK